MHITQPKIAILSGNAGNRIKTLSVEVEITNKWFQCYKKIISRMRQDSQMAQNGHFRRLLSILGYMYWLKMPFFNGKRVNLTFWLNPTI